MIEFVFNWFWRLAKHPRREHYWMHERNIYGDEILYAGGNRSWWVCALCPAEHYDPELYYEGEYPAI